MKQLIVDGAKALCELLNASIRLVGQGIQSLWRDWEFAPVVLMVGTTPTFVMYLNGEDPPSEYVGLPCILVFATSTTVYVITNWETMKRYGPGTGVVLGTVTYLIFLVKSTSRQEIRSQLPIFTCGTLLAAKEVTAKASVFLARYASEEGMFGRYFPERAAVAQAIEEAQKRDIRDARALHLERLRVAVQTARHHAHAVVSVPKVELPHPPGSPTETSFSLAAGTLPISESATDILDEQMILLQERARDEPWSPRPTHYDHLNGEREETYPDPPDRDLLLRFNAVRILARASS